MSLYQYFYMCLYLIHTDNIANIYRWMYYTQIGSYYTVSLPTSSRLQIQPTVDQISIHGWLNPRMENHWMWKTNWIHCTTQFYIRNLGIYRFWLHTAALGTNLRIVRDDYSILFSNFFFHLNISKNINAQQPSHWQPSQFLVYKCTKFIE